MRTAISGNDRKTTRRNQRASDQKLISCVRAAEILRCANADLLAEDREQIAAGIQEARRRMSNEHLH